MGRLVVAQLKFVSDRIEDRVRPQRGAFCAGLRDCVLVCLIELRGVWLLRLNALNTRAEQAEADQKFRAYERTKAEDRCRSASKVIHDPSDGHGRGTSRSVS